MRIIKFCILLVVFCFSFLNLCSADDNINSVMPQKITQYELWWDLSFSGVAVNTMILTGNDKDICSNIEIALKNIVYSGGDPDQRTLLAASGYLVLIDNNGERTIISITDMGFIASEIYTLDKFFHSARLVEIIEKLIGMSTFSNEISF